MSDKAICSVLALVVLLGIVLAGTLVQHEREVDRLRLEIKETREALAVSEQQRAN